MLRSCLLLSLIRLWKWLRDCFIHPISSQINAVIMEQWPWASPFKPLYSRQFLQLFLEFYIALSYCSQASWAEKTELKNIFSNPFLLKMNPKCSFAKAHYEYDNCMLHYETLSPDHTLLLMHVFISVDSDSHTDSWNWRFPISFLYHNNHQHISVFLLPWIHSSKLPTLAEEIGNEHKHTSRPDFLLK